VALVDAVEPEEIGSWAGSGGGVFVMPRDHGDVVAKDTNGVSPAVHLLSENVLMGKQSGQLEI
jgi:hypothetical protein